MSLVQADSFQHYGGFVFNFSTAEIVKKLKLVFLKIVCMTNCLKYAEDLKIALKNTNINDYFNIL